MKRLTRSFFVALTIALGIACLIGSGGGGGGGGGNSATTSGTGDWILSSRQIDFNNDGNIDQEDEYFYDNGLLIRGGTTFYDAAGAWTSEQSYTINYNADGYPTSRVTRYTSSSSATVGTSTETITYDAQDRPLSVQENYDINGDSIVERYRTVQYQYDGTNGKLHSKDERIYIGPPPGGALQSSALIEYEYDANNRLIEIEEHTDSDGDFVPEEYEYEIYSYAPNGRITSVTEEDYDGDGNIERREISTLSYNAENKLVSAVEVEEEFDILGNVVYEEVGYEEYTPYDIRIWPYPEDYLEAITFGSAYPADNFLDFMLTNTLQIRDEKDEGNDTIIDEVDVVFLDAIGVPIRLEEDDRSNGIGVDEVTYYTFTRLP